MKKFLKRLLLSILCVLLFCTIVLVARHHYYKEGLPILGYHHVVSDEEKELYYKDNIYVMSVSVFEKQMKYLYENNYETLTMDQVNSYYKGEYELKENSVCLTFDDGLLSFKEVVKPILEKYDLHATCFVISHKTELENTSKKGKYTYLRKEDLVEDEYVEYYSHSYNLHHKAEGFKKQMEVESYTFILEDFKKGEEIVSSTYFAFPYGRSSEQARKVLEEMQASLAFGYNQNRNMVKEDDPYLLPRYLMFSFMPLVYFKFIVN